MEEAKLEKREDGLLTFASQLKLVAEGVKRGFSYDGCTAVPDFDFGADCCGEHDYHYQDRGISRAEADAKLRKCIQEKGYILLPWIYWLGVRIFGGNYWNKSRAKSLAQVAAEEDPIQAP